MDIYLVIFITLVAALVTSLSQLMFKKGLKKRLDTITDILGTLRNPSVFIGLCGYAVSFALYLVALDNSQLSIVFPVFASSFVFVTLLSMKHLKEAMNAKRISGILLIIAGITIVALTA